ncbi:MAG TPA: DUF1127 domain-containing protein [Dongiaceae bacterium]|jgi:uncharacterized protein YjiS (DUF1127 family)
MSLSCEDTNANPRADGIARMFHPFARFGAMLASPFARFNETLQLWRGRRRERLALGELSDYMLKDIGISRCEVFRETTKHFWHE